MKLHESKIVENARHWQSCDAWSSPQRLSKAPFHWPLNRANNAIGFVFGICFWYTLSACRSGLARQLEAEWLTHPGNAKHRFYASDPLTVNLNWALFPESGFYCRRFWAERNTTLAEEWPFIQGVSRMNNLNEVNQKKNPLCPQSFWTSR